VSIEVEQSGFAPPPPLPSPPPPTWVLEGEIDLKAKVRWWIWGLGHLGLTTSPTKSVSNGLGGTGSAPNNVLAFDFESVDSGVLVQLVSNPNMVVLATGGLVPGVSAWFSIIGSESY
jgi:hypothetical protein